MTIVYADEFRKLFAKLPRDARRLYRTQERRFREDPYDSRLHVKKLHGDPAFFSFRITRRYRVLFVFMQTDAAFFATMGHRKDSYR